MTENDSMEIINDKIETCEFYFAEHDHYPEWCEYEFLEALGIAISAIKEIQQYRAIGTVEECQEAAEKQRQKKLKEILRHRGGFENHHCPNCDTYYQTDNRYTIKDGYCPECGKLLDSAFRNYCGNCGQAISWEESEEE